MQHNKLRGRIVEKYGSILNFSRFLGISQNSAYFKVSGSVGFSREDIIKWAEALEIPNENVYEYFIA